jgi:uncharacterized protein (DUF885 family)
MRMTQLTTATALETLAQRIYREIARQFPVCCASDEFYFFPQVIIDNGDRWSWDDLSAAGVGRFIATSGQWETELKQLGRKALTVETQIDAELLLTMLQTLREQLYDIAPQKNQPSYHLSIIVAGLSEALEADDPSAWHRRIADLPAFLQQAACLLEGVPTLFKQLGEQMLADLQLWFRDLERSGVIMGDGVRALQQFSAFLETCSTRESFTLPDALFDRIVLDHLGSDSPLASLEQLLGTEYEEMDQILTSEAERLVPGQPWQQLEKRLPFVNAPNNDLQQLYRPELLRLEEHARQAGLIPELAGQMQPELADVPESMAAVRASDAYSARVGHPATGGIFYIYERDQGETGRVGRTLEYRMTAAHEAWPGHHLLDICRWNLPRPVRRPLERPLFYEGWACYAEQLMAETGYFDGQWDRFLLARRRIERAARGLVDIGMQTGQLSLTEASQILVQVGYTPQKAALVIPKYALRPGYQVCYTLGLRRMLQLREQCATLDTAAFVRRVLSQGETGFAGLQQQLLTEGD